MKYTVEEVRNAARLLDGLSRRMLTDYAERIKADEVVVAIWQYRRTSDAQWLDCDELDADAWKQTGLHEVRKLFTHPPAQPAIAAELDDYKNAILHAADDCTAKDAEIERYKVAWTEYNDRTEWVQKTAKPKELGLHRADVLRLRIESAESRLAAANALLRFMRTRFDAYMDDSDRAAIDAHLSENSHDHS